ncbi:alpha-keto acid decarboxylase family protein [Flavobacterium hercynium]|uniref:Thiamine pyrophosphate-binding protein n=1 Tax=Flavobacterium hercynium TaxID=387094 RepID=A0A226HGV7_9FLAO|nr:thiamine pyrophosphate-binding protein [Flavobacterium hercynium]OXA93497.1 thiamine pyrophosphate-binding protein [Flavobacterium hercynium]SMP32034.1 indolepyruvate decarboxylase [Flavobacterium hercynium]
MKSTKEFTVADYLLTRLKQLNVTEVFQIPGDYVKHFTQALENFEGIRTIGTSNELDASYAADAYARTRGLAAVSLQYGVSTFSALNAIAGAYVERSPVVVISAAPGADARQIGSMYNVLYHHSTGNLNADQEVYERVTVAAETLSNSVDAPEKIDQLIIAALTHQRPVYIACYKEVWGEPCPKPSDKKLKAEIPKSEVAALENAVSQAWTQITQAKSPLIFAGVEILRHGLSNLLEELIKESGILYTTTSLGKTVLDEKGDKFIGTYSDQASIPEVIKLVEVSDCILSLGTIITDDYLWLVENKFSDMIQATTQEMRVGYFTYNNVTLKDFIEALIQRFKKSNSYPLKTIAPPQPKFPEPWRSNSDPKYNETPNVITFNRFFEHTVSFLEKQKMLQDIVLTFGVSSSMYVATNIYGLSKNAYISSAAWQCIGFETGAASGAQLGSGKQAWTVAGDGGFMMIAQSLSTLVKYNINSVIFVMSNGVYAIEQVYVDMDSFQAGPAHKFDEFDILPKWDYQALAKAFGANSYRAETVSELDDVLLKLKKKTNLPSLVEIIIPQKDLAQQMYRLGNE